MVYQKHQWLQKIEDNNNNKDSWPQPNKWRHKTNSDDIYQDIPQIMNANDKNGTVEDAMESDIFLQ
jgi:hypothetical protein